MSEPGLYRATVRGVADVTVFIDSAGYGRTTEYVLDHREHEPRNVRDARPLIVLDVPEVALRYAIEVLRDPRHKWTNMVADQIEAQTKPARIPEPGLWGVVEASRRELTGRPRIIDTEGNWFKVSDTTGSCVWVHESSEYTANWTDLIDPTLIRDGIES